MPDRIIRERATSSPTLQQLSDAAERAWWRLTVKVDDYGRFDADPDVLLSRLFERKPKGWTLAKIEAALQEWQAGDDPLIHLYRVPDDPRTYGHVIHFQVHQRHRDSKPKFPAPPCEAASDRDSRQLAAICGNSRLARARSGEVSVSVSESREAIICEAGASPQMAANGNTPENILMWLNTKAGKNFRPVAANLDLIRARLKDKILPEQLKAIVSRKVREWQGTEQAKYLRPATLFNKTKCEQYVGELPKPEAADACGVS